MHGIQGCAPRRRGTHVRARRRGVQARWATAVPTPAWMSHKLRAHSAVWEVLKRILRGSERSE
jgi:hypothetical protein